MGQGMTAGAMPIAPTIRRATPADVEALTDLRAALPREMGNVRDEARVAPLASAIRHYLEEKLRGGAFVAWVAEADGRLVAPSASSCSTGRRMPTTWRAWTPTS